YQHLRYLELLCDCGGMQGPRPSVGNERELAWIEAPFDRQLSDREDDVRNRKRDDARGRTLNLETECLGDPCDRPTRRLLRDRHPATEQLTRIKAMQNDVRVRQGRLESTTLKTRGTGTGARTLWTGMQHAAPVEPGARAASGADRVDVDHGRGNRRPKLDLKLAPQVRLALMDDRDIGARATDVHADRVFDTAVAKEGKLRDHSRRRPGEQRCGRR